MNVIIKNIDLIFVNAFSFIALIGTKMAITAEELANNKVALAVSIIVGITVAVFNLARIINSVQKFRQNNAKEKHERVMREYEIKLKEDELKQKEDGEQD